MQILNFIISLFKWNGYLIVFILNVIDKFKNKFKNLNRQFPTDFPNNTPNLNPYLTLPYIGTPTIKFSNHLALFHDRLNTDIKIAYQTFKILYLFMYKSENFVPNYCPKSWGATYTRGCFKSLKIFKYVMYRGHAQLLLCVS